MSSIYKDIKQNVKIRRKDKVRDFFSTPLTSACLDYLHISLPFEEEAGVHY